MVVEVEPRMQRDVASSVCSPKHVAEDTAEALAEALERRLATRLGQQVLQLSEVLPSPRFLHGRVESGHRSMRALTPAPLARL